MYMYLIVISMVIHLLVYSLALVLSYNAGLLQILCFFFFLFNIFHFTSQLVIFNQYCVETSTVHVLLKGHFWDHKLLSLTVLMYKMTGDHRTSFSKWHVYKS